MEKEYADEENKPTQEEENPEFPHANRFKQKNVFNDNEDDNGEPDEEERAKAKKVEEHWKPENHRPSWQLHSELGPHVGAQASIVRKQPQNS